MERLVGLVRLYVYENATVRRMELRSVLRGFDQIEVEHILYTKMHTIKQINLISSLFVSEEPFQNHPPSSSSHSPPSSPSLSVELLA